MKPKMASNTRTGLLWATYRRLAVATDAKRSIPNKTTRSSSFDYGYALT